MYIWDVSIKGKKYSITLNPESSEEPLVKAYEGHDLWSLIREVRTRSLLEVNIWDHYGKGDLVVFNLKEDVLACWERKRKRHVLVSLVLVSLLLLAGYLLM